MNNLLTEIESLGCAYLENAPLGSYSSLRIGGTARFAVWPETADQVRAAIQVAKNNGLPYFILGNCSNVLVMDEGLDGIVILMGKTGTNFRNIEKIDETTISVEAGVSLRELCMFAYNEGLTGMEFAYGIPAAVGGAIYMNSGAYDGEIKDIVVECTFLNEDGEIVTLSNKDLDFSYRHSYFHDHACCILSAVVRLQKGDKTAIKAKMDEFLHRRISKQPLEYPSAGSTFKRPGGAFAAKLIDDSGLKGYRVGGAMVSEKHAGFVINYKNASSEDMLQIVEHIQKTVKEKTGFSLECEMIILKNK